MVWLSLSKCHSWNPGSLLLHRRRKYLQYSFSPLKQTDSRFWTDINYCDQGHYCIVNINSMLTCTAWQFRLRGNVHCLQIFKLDKHNQSHFLWQNNNEYHDHMYSHSNHTENWTDTILKLLNNILYLWCRIPYVILMLACKYCILNWVTYFLIFQQTKQKC